MDFKKEHVKFHVYVERKSGNSARVIHDKLTNVFGYEIAGFSTIKKWCSKIDENAFSLSDVAKSGRPSTSHLENNVQKVNNLITNNKHLSTRQIAAELDLNKETVRQILKNDLERRKVCSIWIPHKLSDENRVLRVTIAKEILQSLEILGDNVYRLYAVTDESWINHAAMGTKQENKVWLKNGEKPNQIVRSHLTKEKSMMMAIYTADHKFNIEMLPYGQTVTSETYCNFLKQTGEKWRRLHSTPTKLSEIYLQHDNARPHTSKETKNFIEYREITLIRQPPYSPDFNMLDRWLFSYLKKSLHKKNFANSEEIKKASLQLFHDVTDNRLQNEISKFKLHLHNVIKERGNYVS